MSEPKTKITTTIKLIDENVDGCGTDVDTIIDAIGPMITLSIINGLKDAVDVYKAQNPGEWDSDGCFDTACDFLKQNGYRVTFHTADIEIIL